MPSEWTSAEFAQMFLPSLLISSIFPEGEGEEGGKGCMGVEEGGICNQLSVIYLRSRA